MDLSTLLMRLRFWTSDPDTHWSLQSGEVVPLELNEANKEAIEDAITLLWSTPAGEALLTAAAANGARIRFAGDATFAHYVPRPGGQDYLSVNVPNLADLYTFNATGSLVHVNLAAVLAHELAHKVHGPGAQDPQGTGPNGAVTEADMNGPSFDFVGTAVPYEHAVMDQLRLSADKRLSYAVGLKTSDLESLSLVHSVSYTNGQTIDIARLGLPGNDTQDHSARSDNSRDLIFGFAGNDILRGGGGNDFLYGGADNDILEGGNGSDVLVGGTGADIIRSGAGDDILWGGDKDTDLGSQDGMDHADYSSAASSISITFAGSSSANELTVKDGDNGIDTLHSIEVIKGTPGRDTVRVIGEIPTGLSLKIDANGGQGPAPSDTINLSQASKKTSLVLTEEGIGYVMTEGGGQILLANFHTQIVGSAYDDTITDDASGDKKIKGGGGDDVISVSVGAALIDGGEGDDELNGGAGNDTLVGGAGTNVLNGGGGADLLIGSSQGDVLDGGAGHDKLVLTAAVRDVILRGGTGNDVIDARAAVQSFPNYGPPSWYPGEPAPPLVTVQFRAGDGHDLLLGDGHQDNRRLRLAA